MDKKTIIEQVLNTYNTKEVLLKRQKFGSKVTYERLLLAILNSGSLSLADSLIGISSPSGIANLTKALFPDKPRTSINLDTFLLGKVSLKECNNCNSILPFEFFRKNAAKRDGLNCHCKDCHAAGTAITQPARQSKYRAAKLERTPSWANISSIKRFYDNCQVGMHVDHIVPLQGELVCGLHVENNLQYLTAKENCSKGNR